MTSHQIHAHTSSHPHSLTPSPSHTQAGGKLIQEGMEENATLVTFDLRLTELNEENEYCINQIVKNNQDGLKKR